MMRQTIAFVFLSCFVASNLAFLFPGAGGGGGGCGCAAAPACAPVAAPACAPVAAAPACAPVSGCGGGYGGGVGGGYGGGYSTGGVVSGGYSGGGGGQYASPPVYPQQQQQYIPQPQKAGYAQQPQFQSQQQSFIPQPQQQPQSFAQVPSGGSYQQQAPPPPPPPPSGGSYSEGPAAAAAGGKLQEVEDELSNAESTAAPKTTPALPADVIEPVDIKQLKLTDDSDCNSEELRTVILENIDDDLNSSKRLIQLAAEAKFGGRFDVICATNDFSYVTNTELFCQHTKEKVSCYAYRQL